MLRFADDQVLVVVERTVRTIGLSGHRGHALDVAAENVIDLVGFPDQIWVAARDAAGGASLHRFALDGKPLEETPLALPSPHGRWVTGARTACATWHGPAPVIASAAPGLVLTPITERGDLTVPFSPGRVVMARGPNATLRTAGGVRWSTSVFAQPLHVEDGAFLYDASSIALVGASSAGARSIAVLTTRDGALQQRLSVASGASIQFAARRGQALVRIDRRLLLIDLRFARIVGDYEHSEPIEAVAINPSATAIAVLTRDRAGGIALAHLSSRELIASTAYVVPGPAAPVVAALSEEPEPGSAAAPAACAVAAAPAAPPSVESAEPAPAARFDVLDPPALLPRSRAARADPAQARALLERERAVIAASCYLATAQAWDQGRIVWDSESEHPYETELLGLLERQRGRAVERIAEATRALAASEAALASARAAVTTLLPIDELGRELALSPLARRILLVVAAPTIWGEVARMYGILANDSERAVVDEMLIRQVLGDHADVHEIARELDPDLPLVRRGAVRIGAGSMRPFLALQVDPLVIKWLRGDSLGDGADADLRVIETSRPIEQLLLPPGAIERLREALCRTTSAPLRLVVRGRAGAGRRTLIAALAHTANRKLAMLDAAPLVRDGRIRTDEIALRLQRAALGGWLPCVDNLEIVGHDDRSAREQLQEIFRRHPGPVAFRLGSDATPPLDPGYLAIDLPPLSETRRLDAWNVALAERGLALTDVEDLASRWVLGPGTVHRVLDQLVDRGGTAGESAEVVSRLDGVIRQHLETRLGDLATRVTRLARWSQIVLPPDILDSLLELVARIRHRRTVFERWGYDRVMTTSRGVTALFQGGPGTGKTMVASAIARELGLDVYRVDLSRIVSKWIGETERNLAQLFDAAEDGQAMILFDEADSLFAKRTEVKSSVDRYANLEVNYLLQRLDSFGGIAILTTNFGGAIDTAFKRRLSFRLSFPFPDDEMREQLWRVHLPPELPRAGDLDFGELARKYKMSGGYIRNAALRAAFLAAAEESGLHHDHLERAVRLEYREIGKLAETGALE